MSPKRSAWLIPILACIALVIVLWLPFGLKVSGIMEEWLVLHDVEKGELSERNEDYALFITTGVHRMRPLVGVAPITAYTLTPDSFVGFNLVAMALFAGKGLLLYLILRRLAPSSKVFAILAALLFVVYPADSGLFTFRAISIHLSVFWYLLGVYLFVVVYFQSGKWLALIGAWAATIGSLWIYEVGYPLIALTPLLLILLEGRLDKRVVRAGLLWYVAPLIAFLYVALIFVQGESYQSWVLQRSGLNQSSVIGEMLTSVYNAYYRHFVEGWVQALEAIKPLYLALALTMGGIAFGVGMLLRGEDAVNGRRRYWVLVLLGFAVIGLGYLPFLITPYRQLDWRVYYYSSIGGAICVGSLVYLLVSYLRLRPVAFVGIMGLLIALGTLRSLNQHQYYADLALSEQELLHAVVEQVPHLKTEAPLVVIDETGRYNSNWSLGSSYLVKFALRYIYADYELDAVLCSFDPTTKQFRILPEQKEQCAFTPEGIVVSREGSDAGFYPYDDMVMVRYSDSGAELLTAIPEAYLPTGESPAYNPLPFVDQDAPPPYRFNTVFSLPD